MQTRKEIFAQYDALKQTIDAVAAAQAQVADLMPAKAILFTGCGSSFSIGCSLRSIASARLSVPVYALAAGDLWLNCPQYANMLKDTLVVSVSRSGQTSELVKAYEAVKAMNCGARFLSIICANDTPLEALSDVSICIPWAFDHSVCQTRCVSNLYSAAAMCVGIWSNDDAIMADFRAVASIGAAYLDRAEPICKAIAEKGWDNVVVLADGQIDGLAEEGALAFKEISQLHSNYYHILDCRHGPMVLFKEDTLVIVALQSPANTYEEALVADVLKKGCTVIRYSAQPLEALDNATSISLDSNVGSIAAGLGLVNLCQMLSYHKSFQVGCNPDQPDGLSPWIKI